MEKIDLKLLSHHAYCFVGPESLSLQLKETLAKEHGVKTDANPDFFERKYDIFAIDDARDLKSLHETMPVAASGRKIFILSMNGITAEAQNALLKLLEEPAAYAHFFLILPSSGLLLVTVKSRLLVIETRQGGKSADLSEAKKFLKLHAAKKLETLKSLLDSVAKENKTKQDAVDFLDAVERAVYEESGANNGKRALQAIELARKYLNDRAPSLKMLLEYAALNL